MAACGAPPDTDRLPVAELDGKILTVSDVKAYFEANLIAAEGEEAPTPPDLDRVKSRLFDNFLDEEILLLEAQRQGIQVGDDEVEAYLRGGTDESESEPPTDERRRMARRDLAIQKLREGYVRKATLTPDEVDAYLQEHRDALAPERQLLLRSLMLNSEAEAKRIREDLSRHRISFDEAVVASGAAAGQGEPLEVDLDSLPEEVRLAVASLKAGEVAEPVVVQGNVYLFLVKAWVAGAGDREERLRRRAREELLRAKYEEASRRLLEEIRAKIRPKVDFQNLPFRYVREQEG